MKRIQQIGILVHVEIDVWEFRPPPDTNEKWTPRQKRLEYGAGKGGNKKAGMKTGRLTWQLCSARE